MAAIFFGAIPIYGSLVPRPRQATGAERHGNETSAKLGTRLVIDSGVVSFLSISGHSSCLEMPVCLFVSVSVVYVCWLAQIVHNYNWLLFG